MYIRLNRDQNGYLFIVPYLIVFSVIIDVLVSGRDVSLGFSEFLSERGSRGIIAALIKQTSTLLILLACFHRFFLAFRNGVFLQCPPVLIAGIGYWLASVLFAGIFAFEPDFQHHYTYSILIFVALALQGREENLEFIRAFRNAMVVFSCAGLMMVFIKPEMVLESSYTEESLFNLPRFLGFASHSVAMSFKALFLVACLVYFPYRNRYMNGIFIAIGVVLLFWAQSKNVMVVFLLVLVVYLFNSLKSSEGVGIGTLRLALLSYWGLLLAVFTLYFLAMMLVFFDLQLLVSIAGDFTGRDVLWSRILQDERSFELFGYGVNYFRHLDEIYFSHGHNQFMDTMIKSGQIGLFGLITYLAVLLFYSLLSSGKSRGLTLIFLIILLFRSFTEVPMRIHSYSLDFLIHLVILAAIYINSTHIQWSRSLVINPAKE